jgi:peroxiredoxin Q/BCP
MKAPDFTLPDSEGRLHSLSDYRGKWLVVYFYPKDDTPGCTKEACNFRDNRDTLQEHGIAVVGISRDSVVSHKAFAGKYALNFPILSDESTETIRA